MTQVRHPAGDSVPPEPDDWEDLQLGPGQADGPLAKLQYSRKLPRDTNIRRHEDYEHVYIVEHPPERPA